ncbi:MAG: hypothetical protein K5917_05040, partial [Clostridiales bacterium]|nr:hypothetical protein [Clostridiales bacterium]
MSFAQVFFTRLKGKGGKFFKGKRNMGGGVIPNQVWDDSGVAGQRAAPGWSRAERPEGLTVRERRKAGDGVRLGLMEIRASAAKGFAQKITLKQVRGGGMARGDGDLFFCDFFEEGAGVDAVYDFSDGVAFEHVGAAA